MSCNSSKFSRPEEGCAPTSPILSSLHSKHGVLGPSKVRLGRIYFRIGDYIAPRVSGLSDHRDLGTGETGFVRLPRVGQTGRPLTRKPTQFDSDSIPLIVLVIPTAYSGDTQSTAWFAVPLARPDVFIVCIAMFGSAESSSPSNTPAPFDGPRFPGVAVRDNAVAQRTLLDSLWPEAGKIDVVGWSMGAAQAFHWSVLYPEKVRKFVALCGSARTARHNWTFLEGIKRALLCDPEFCEGDYKRLGKEPKKGLEAFGTVYCSYGTSQAYFRNERWKELGVPSLEVYISVWVQHFSSKDANDLLCQLGAWQGSDVSKGGDLAETLGKVEAECLIMPCGGSLPHPL